MADELEVLALAFAREALDKQDATLSELRARTGTLLAASSIVSSFLGATAIGRDGLSGWSVAALVAGARPGDNLIVMAAKPSSPPPPPPPTPGIFIPEKRGDGSGTKK